MNLTELLIVLAVLAVIVWRALSWRQLAKDYRVSCEQHQHTILMQERELIELRPYKRNHDHRVEKRAML